MKKLEMLRPERNADSTTIDVATPDQNSTRGQSIHQAPVYAPTNNGAPECEKMPNTNGRSKTTLTGSGIDSGAQPAGTTKMVYAAPSAPLGSSLSTVFWMALLTIASASVIFPKSAPGKNAFSIPRARSMPQGHDRRNAVSNAGRPNHSSKKNATGRIPSKTSMPTSPQPPRRKPERPKRLLEKRGPNSKGPTSG